MAGIAHERRGIAHTSAMGAEKIKTWVGRVRAAYGVLADHRFTTIAGTLVFFLLMSLAPLLFWMTLLFGQAAPGSEILEDLGLFGWAEDLINFLLKNASESTAGVNALFLVTTLWSSTGFFYHLRRSGEIIYGYERKKHGWKVRVSAIALTFVVLLFLAAAGGVLVTLSVLTRGLPVWLSRPVFYAAVLLLGFFAAWILNAYVCPYRTSPADTALGSLVTAALWLLASAAFSVYLHFTDQEKLYGALALVIVFLLWLYWMMILFTAGAIFNRRRMVAKTLRHKLL